MTPTFSRVIFSSIKFYRKPVLYQVLIIALLSAVITGSLLTGKSVRTSLKKSSHERLGNTGILISSGIRYFDTDLADRLKEDEAINCTGLLEIIGYCQSLNSQRGAFNTHIFGIRGDFFSFHGIDSISVKKDEVLINRRLADHLDVKAGDELIIRFASIGDIPADAPFAPDAEEGNSIVLKIGDVLGPGETGNFSLSISQITPMNIFLNLSDLADESGKPLKINRLLIDKKINKSIDETLNVLTNTLRLSDSGLRLRKIAKTGGSELVSDRIFIDEAIVDEVFKKIPSSAPVITYLGNRIESASRSTPYSFVAAIPSSIYPDIASENEIIINDWLADDLHVIEGDTLNMFWYSPDSLNKLIESSNIFVIRRIVKIEGIWGDSLLMPDFPGIAGSESCSEWDAGVPVKMDNIRDKDEEYWKKFKGTPKAFINYRKGKEIWGSNFGPATAMRFPEGLAGVEIEAVLNGSLAPGLMGFTVTDLAGESILAADESVDFSTLFLSLGFFLILASVVLLSFIVSYYFDSKKENIRTLFALGFKNKWIEKLFFLESTLIGVAGSFVGAFSGYLVNIIITWSLNTVWSGAVQTNTLSASFDIIPILTGFMVTIMIITVFMRYKTRKFLKSLNRQEKEYHKFASPRINLFFLIGTIVITISLFTLSILWNDKDTVLSFGAGTLLLITFILLWRQLYIGRTKNNFFEFTGRKNLSRLYYSFNPSHAVTPILFIAAGIFALFITGVNRMDFDETLLKRSSGTGGYLLWCESNIPLTDDLSTIRGRSELGLTYDTLSGMDIITMKRSAGNDASCLNLNHITAPPLLGIDPADFIARESFSFAKELSDDSLINAWQFLNLNSGTNTIYGIADKTVMDWGLKLNIGDTLILRAENGQPINIILAAGLKSSVFQGYVIIGKENFNRYFPSVSGSSVLLVDGDPGMGDFYKSTLYERLSNYGVNIEFTKDRLRSFYEVTNTYLSVFGVFGAFGMITGVLGLGFVLIRNYNHRKREFALMLATGFTFRKIRRININEQIIILFAGVTTGVLSAISATLPSLRSGQDIPWIYLIMIILAILITGLSALFISIRSLSGDALIASLRKE
jgi:ABC-type antimicrobial peptide transport system permease subunit